jgi:hypothetical protein
MKTRPVIRVIVEAAPQRKGWRWRQITRNGATGGSSPQTYDTKGLAKRAGQRQVEVLNGSLKYYGFTDASTRQLHGEAPYAVLVVNEP